MADRYWGRLEFPAALIDAEVTEALQEEGVEMDKLDPSEHADDYAWIEDGILSWKIPKPGMAAGKTWKTS